jgi:hypothetical protein
MTTKGDDYAADGCSGRRELSHENTRSPVNATLTRRRRYKAKSKKPNANIFHRIVNYRRNHNQPPMRRLHSFKLSDQKLESQSLQKIASIIVWLFSSF